MNFFSRDPQLENMEDDPNLPVCQHCHKPITEDTFYEIDGDCYCQDCMDKLFRRDLDEYLEEEVG